MEISAFAIAAGLIGWAPAAVDTPPSAPSTATMTADPAVVASPSGASISWDALIDGLLSARVIAVGEMHPAASHHQAQARVIAAVAARDPSAVVGLEMVSQDQQAILDDFLSGKKSEADFSRWWTETWGFPYPLYKPIFDAARAGRLRMVGLNAPISLVTKVARQGLASLTPAERASLPPSIEESRDARYRDFVKRALEGHHLPPDKMAHLIEAQAVWNETMGAKAAELASSGRVLVIAGSGHLVWRAGIAESALRRGAGSAAVILPYPLDGERLPLPDQLKRLLDPANDELPMADDFLLIP